MSSSTAVPQRMVLDEVRLLPRALWQRERMGRAAAGPQLAEHLQLKEKKNPKGVLATIIDFLEPRIAPLPEAERVKNNAAAARAERQREQELLEQQPVCHCTHEWAAPRRHLRSAMSRPLGH